MIRILALLPVLLMTAPLLAQTADEGVPAAAQANAPAAIVADVDDSAPAGDAYRPAEDGEIEPVPGGTFMLLAYLALWVATGGYLFRLASRHRAVQAELGVLRRLLEDIDDRLNELS